MDRRKFIAAGLAGTAIGCGRARREPRTEWRFFTGAEGRTVEALCAHIIPDDQDPGAVQAGVTGFIDRQLTRFYKPLRKTYRDGIAAASRESLSLGDCEFAELPIESQRAVIRRIETDPATKPFFDLLVAHAMQGFYGSPRHGGNRDRVSWKMLGVASPPLRGRA
jgi:gluconate 2-dehydrogenase gamma chain